ncbi:hypothetical protein Esti_005779 [Eimeria stiedai]
MGGPPVTSLEAYSFAADFVEFERRKNEELEQAATKWKRTGDEETTKAVTSDPKEVIGTADYEVWWIVEEGSLSSACMQSFAVRSIRVIGFPRNVLAKQKE